MVATIPYNPYVTTNAAGSFNVLSGGLWQGMPLDDPSVRNYLAGGVLATSETLPMWGGVAISEAVPGSTGNPNAVLGSIITRATTNTVTSANGLTGFSVFQQNYSAVNTPQSPVPLVASGGQVNFYRLGSGARIPVALDPSLISLEGSIISSQVSWDFTNQRLQPYDASTATFAISSATWASTGGGTLTIVAGAAVPFGLGDTVSITGATNSGSGGAGVINNSFVINGYTDNEHFTLAAPAASGVFGTIAGSPVINAGTGALNVRVLKFEIGNSATVSYSPTVGGVWNRTDSCALILI